MSLKSLPAEFQEKINAKIGEFESFEGDLREHPEIQDPQFPECYTSVVFEIQVAYLYLKYDDDKIRFHKMTVTE